MKPYSELLQLIQGYQIIDITRKEDNSILIVTDRMDEDGYFNCIELYIDAGMIQVGTIQVKMKVHKVQ